MKVKTIIICGLLTLGLTACGGEKEAPKPTHKPRVEYLLISNGGTMVFFDDGKKATCARCDGVSADAMRSDGLIGYTRYTNYLIDDDGSSIELFEENGNITIDWAVLNFHSVDFRQTVATFVTDPVAENEIQDITKTSMIEMPIEPKYTEGEEYSEEFAAESEWGLFIHETESFIKERGTKSITPKKRYLRFHLDDGPSIIVDTSATINGIRPHVLLYRAGKLPIIVDNLDVNQSEDADAIERYLK